MSPEVKPKLLNSGTPLHLFVVVANGVSQEPFMNQKVMTKSNEVLVGLYPIYPRPGGWILYVPGSKRYECTRCGMIYKRTKKGKEKLTRCSCGGPLIPRDFKLVVIMGGRMLFPNYSQLGQYLIGHPYLYQAIEHVYKDDQVLTQGSTGEDDLFLHYLLHLFRNEERNYPRAEGYKGKKMTFDFFKMLHDSYDLNDALRVAFLW